MLVKLNHNRWRCLHFLFLFFFYFCSELCVWIRSKPFYNIIHMAQTNDILRFYYYRKKNQLLDEGK